MVELRWLEKLVPASGGRSIFERVLQFRQECTEYYGGRPSVGWSEWEDVPIETVYSSNKSDVPK